MIDIKSESTERDIIPVNMAKICPYSIPNPIPYPQVFQFRQQQVDVADISNLSPTQWGLVELEKCHHISITTPVKDGPPSYRVRVCKTCCQNDGHIELGTYIDQESAILVNDVHEILNERFDKLILLRPDDREFLHLLHARKYDRHRGKDFSNILSMLSERQVCDEKRKRLKSGCEMSPDVEDSNGDLDEMPHQKRRPSIDFDSKKMGNYNGLNSNLDVNNSHNLFSNGSSSVGNTNRRLSEDFSLLTEVCAVRSPLRTSRPRAATYGGTSFDDSLSALSTLASLEDEDFSAAKTLSELSSVSEDQVQLSSFNKAFFHIYN